MPKIKMFNEEEALTSLVKLFRTRGFSATSMSAIAEVSGLHPGSIYNSFGNKEHLFSRVIDCYTEGVVRPRVSKYLSSDYKSPVEGIKKLFLTTFLGTESAQDGCLLTNTSLESNICTPQILSQLHIGFAILEKGFFEQIKRAIEIGEISKDANPQSLAKQLFVNYQGFLILVRSKKSKQELKGYLKEIFKILEKESV